jgi:cytochrome bd-type quinol oxidase subunit 2
MQNDEAAMEYGAAVTWIIIVFIIFVTGILYMMLTPLIDTFLQIGADSGADTQTMQVIRDALKIYFPIVVIFSLVVYGWRKSRNRIE